MTEGLSLQLLRKERTVMIKKKNKELTEEEKEVIRTKSFFDMILPQSV